MRIAQVAPLYESVPPRLYGGTERVVSWLTEELVSLGHDVTLFASGDSVTNARLISGSNKALRLDPDCVDPLAHHILMIEQGLRNGGGVRPYPLPYRLRSLSPEQERASAVPDDTTWQAGSARPAPALQRIQGYVVGIDFRCPAQTALRWANWIGTVRHGLPANALSMGKEAREGYLAFLGRICQKRASIRPSRSRFVRA